MSFVKHLFVKSLQQFDVSGLQGDKSSGYDTPCMSALRPNIPVLSNLRLEWRETFLELAGKWVRELSVQLYRQIFLVIFSTSLPIGNHQKLFSYFQNVKTIIIIDGMCMLVTDGQIATGVVYSDVC